MINCPQCGNLFDEKTGRRPKKFCSDACKVRFWNGRKNVARKLREAGVLVPPTFDDPNHTPLSPPKVSYFPPHTVEYDKAEIQTQIDALEKQLSTIAEGIYGTPMRNKIQDKIAKLKRQLKDSI